MRRLSFHQWSFVIIGFVLVGLALTLIADAFYIGFLAPNSVVNEWHFGSEAMVGHGGWGYTSREAYFWSSLYKTMLFWLPGVILLVVGLRPTASIPTSISSALD